MFLSNILMIFFFGNKNNETNTQHKRHSKNSKLLSTGKWKEKVCGIYLKYIYVYVRYECIYERKERTCTGTLNNIKRMHENL